MTGQHDIKQLFDKYVEASRLEKEVTYFFELIKDDTIEDQILLVKELATDKNWLSTKRLNDWLCNTRTEVNRVLGRGDVYGYLVKLEDKGANK